MSEPAALELQNVTRIYRQAGSDLAAQRAHEIPRLGRVPDRRFEGGERRAPFGLGHFVGLH